MGVGKPADIVEAVDKVARVIQDVHNAAVEQNSGVSQINQAISQMDDMTQQNAALVEQTSAASRSMSEEARSMSNLIAFFRLRDGLKATGYPSRDAEEAAPPVAHHAEPSAKHVVSDLPGDDPVSSYINDIYR